jgi:hypothetical protein
MGGTSITLLFSTDKNTEPPGILQCDTSGEFYPFYFNDWRDAVHYIQWCKQQNNGREHNMFNKWSKLYGYDEDETFIGDLNEFKTNESDSWCVWVHDRTIDSNVDLNTLSVWNWEQKCDSGSDSD